MRKATSTRNLAVLRRQLIANVSTIALPSASCQPRQTASAPLLQRVTCPHRAVLRSYAAKKKNFFESLLDNVQEEIAKNKELNENMRKLREEAERLEKSDGIKNARAKYEQLEERKAAWRASSEKLRSAVRNLADSTQKIVQESAIGKRSSEVTDGMLKQARERISAFESSVKGIGESDTFKIVMKALAAVKREIEDLELARITMYIRPTMLRKRSEMSASGISPLQSMKANEEVTEVQASSSSTTMFSTQWESFRQSSFYNRVVDWKLRYDENDGLFARSFRAVGDGLSNMFSFAFKQGDLPAALTEIVKYDPYFDLDRFILYFEVCVVPNILEAVRENDMEILKDWCSETALRQLTFPQETAAKLGYKHDLEVVDLNRPEVFGGKVTEYGPVLIMMFVSQERRRHIDSQGNIVPIEGINSASTHRVTHLWVMLREPEGLDPSAAWKLMEVHIGQPQALLI